MNIPSWVFLVYYVILLFRCVVVLLNGNMEWQEIKKNEYNLISERFNYFINSVKR